MLSGFVVLVVEDLLLEKLPEAFNWIKIWRIGRKIDKLIDLRRPVVGSVVHDKLDEFTRRVFGPDCPEKFTNRHAVNSFGSSRDDVQRFDVDGPVYI